MYLTSIVHRDRLFEVATRWFADRYQAGDGRFVTEAFIFENVISAPTVRAFLRDVQRAAAPGAIRMTRLRSKDEVREAIIRGCVSPTPREAELFAAFRERPEEFFPRTPVDLALVTRDDGSIFGMVRVKRLRRVAEKASRRVADALAGRIRDAARANAAGRARAAGVPLDQLFSTPDAMLDDFAAAEQLVSRAFRGTEVAFTRRDLRVDDVIGAKFIGPPADLAAIEREIRRHPRVLGIEREEHQGRYNDVNLGVDLELPPPAAIVDAASGQDWSFAAGRGLPVDSLRRDFPAYVESGARSFRAEVILTTREELVESEFGRAMHEQRILEQRGNASYSGRIASNASFLIEYMLMLAVSPTVEVETLPVRMWGRYLPDVFSLSVWRLFGIPGEFELADPFAPDVVEFVERGAAR